MKDFLPKRIAAGDNELGAIRTYTPSKGWITEEIFYHIIGEFLEHVEQRRARFRYEPYHPAVLISDGHSSRYSTRTLGLLREHAVKLLILPPHTKQGTQPLDRLFYNCKQCFTKLLPKRIKEMEAVQPRATERLHQPFPPRCSNTSRTLRGKDGTQTWHPRALGHRRCHCRCRRDGIHAAARR